MRYRYINVHEFHGYFNFCGIEPILISTQKLEKLGLIEKDNNRKCFVPTQTCSDYILYRRKNKRKEIYQLISALAAVATILGFILSRRM
ncbi:hypothetical protein [Amedibacterium intestinale]|uniref:hypothetical protein n=1 Tax=Amedibacterium intestinale TaxID=2583452 RepID=UPI0013002223